jgi:hypothetical protein
MSDNVISIFNPKKGAKQDVSIPEGESVEKHDPIDWDAIAKKNQEVQDRLAESRKRVVDREKMHRNRNKEKK